MAPFKTSKYKHVKNIINGSINGDLLTLSHLLCFRLAKLCYQLRQSLLQKEQSEALPFSTRPRAVCSVGTGRKRIGSQSSIAEYVGPISSLVQPPSTHVRIDPDVVPSIFAFSELKEKENLGHCKVSTAAADA